jgi:predicted RNase H-like nuclease
VYKKRDGTTNLLTDFFAPFWCSGAIELKSRTQAGEKIQILRKLKYHQYTLHDTDPAADAGAAAVQDPAGISVASEIKPYRQQIERGLRLFHIVSSAQKRASSLCCVYLSIHSWRLVRQNVITFAAFTLSLYVCPLKLRARHATTDDTGRTCAATAATSSQSLFRPKAA